MDNILSVQIYADTTGQYSEEEILQMQDTDEGAVISIPVPEKLLKQWWFDCLEFDRQQVPVPEGGWPTVTDDDFYRWWNEESMTQDLDSLYDWLVAHNYHWYRLD